MPYPNEHAVRIHNPGIYEHYARKTIAPGVDIILGIREGKTEVQAYRFSKEKFTIEEVKEWLKKHGIENYIKIEPASEKDDLKFYGKVKDELPILSDNVKSDKRTDKLMNYHLDYNILNINNLIRPFELTPEGYLVGKAIVTNIGVFEYSDGVTIRRELRLPEEVFSMNSLKTLQLKPLTNNHPTSVGGLIDSRNIKNYIVGYSGNFRFDDSKFIYSDEDVLNYFGGYFVAIDLCIFDKETISEIMMGKRALSCGYTCELEKAPEGARYLGMPYDYIQRNIKYNHIAIVDTARAGEQSKIILKSDSNEELGSINVWMLNSFLSKEKEVEEINSDKKQKDKNKKGGNTKMDGTTLKTIVLDGIEYQAEPEVIKQFKTLQNRLDVLEKEKEELQKNFDSLKQKLEGERDALKAELENKIKEIEKIKNDEFKKAVREEVAEKIKLIEIAKEFKMDNIDINQDGLEIKKSILKFRYPDLNLDGKTLEYVNARFDMLIELYQKEKEEKNKEAVKVDKAEEIKTAEQIRKSMIEELKKQSRLN